MKKLSNQSVFFIFLLEKYAAHKSLLAADVLQQWQDNGLLPYINSMYEQYHTERIENAFADIDEKLKQGIR